MINKDQLKFIMPHLSDERCDIFFPFLQSAMIEFEINTELRVAAFLAQIAHESGEFKYMEEIWGPTTAQKNYEPTTHKSQELGNTSTGDGKRYKGRGPIQITGKANYKKYGDILAIDLVNHPEKAASPEIAFRIAGSFWKTHGLNELADHESFEVITRRINGGINGLEDRRKYYDRAKKVLGI
jgi:predicted chitinase